MEALEIAKKLLVAATESKYELEDETLKAKALSEIHNKCKELEGQERESLHSLISPEKITLNSECKDPKISQDKQIFNPKASDTSDQTFESKMQQESKKVVLDCFEDLITLDSVETLNYKALTDIQKIASSLKHFEPNVLRINDPVDPVLTDNEKGKPNFGKANLLENKKTNDRNLIDFTTLWDPLMPGFEEKATTSTVHPTSSLWNRREDKIDITETTKTDEKTEATNAAFEKARHRTIDSTNYQKDQCTPIFQTKKNREANDCKEPWENVEDTTDTSERQVKQLRHDELMSVADKFLQAMRMVSGSINTACFEIESMIRNGRNKSDQDSHCVESKSSAEQSVDKKDETDVNVASTWLRGSHNDDMDLSGKNAALSTSIKSYEPPTYSIQLEAIGSLADRNPAQRNEKIVKDEKDNLKLRKDSKRQVKKPNKFSPSDFIPKQRKMVVTSPENMTGFFVDQPKKTRSFCVCGKETKQDMVRCSNVKHCHLLWYHYSGDNPCVQYDPVKYNHKKWYCPACRKEEGVENKKRLNTEVPIEIEVERQEILGSHGKNESFHAVVASEISNDQYRKPKSDCVQENENDDQNQGSVDTYICDLETEEKEHILIDKAKQRLCEKYQPLRTKTNAPNKIEEIRWADITLQNLRESTPIKASYTKENESKNSISKEEMTKKDKEKSGFIARKLQKFSGWITNDPVITPEKPINFHTSSSPCEKQKVKRNRKQNYVNPHRTAQVQIVEETLRQLPLQKVLVAKGIDESRLNYKLPKLINIEIPYTEWKTVWSKEEPGKLRNGYAQVIDDHLAELDVPCSFNALKYHPLKTKRIGSFTIYGYCRGLSCPVKFKCKVRHIKRKRPVIIDISTVGECRIVQSEGSGRILSAFKRKLIKEELLKHKPYKMFALETAKVNDMRFLHQNNPISGLRAVQNARQESLNDRKSKKTNLVNDCSIVRTKLLTNKLFKATNAALNSGVLHRIHHIPFSVGMYSPLQVQFASLTDMLYIDATGGIVGTPYVDSKRTLLHAVVASIKDAPDVPYVPIFEFLSNLSCTSEITSQLLDFVGQVKLVDRNWQPKMVTCDFSFAYLHSYSFVFNHEPLVNYINRCFIKFSNGEDVTEDITKLQICIAHLLNAFSRNLSRSAVPKDIRRLAMHAMAKFIEISNYQEFKDTVSQFITVFGCQEGPADIIKKFAHDFENASLQHPYEEFIADFHLTIKTDEELLESIPEMGDRQLQREQSKYFQYFEHRCVEVKKSYSETLKSDTMSNPYYNRLVIKIFGETYMPYFPLWSNACPIHNLLGSQMVDTTMKAENFFGVHKNNFHETRNMYFPDYAEQHAPIIHGIVNNALQTALKPSILKLSTSAKTGTPVKNHAIDSDDEINKAVFFDKTSSQESTEDWNKKKKGKRPLYRHRNLKTYFTKRADDISIPENEVPPEKLVKDLRRKLKKKKSSTITPKKSSKRKSNEMKTQDARRALVFDSDDDFQSVNNRKVNYRSYKSLINDSLSQKLEKGNTHLLTSVNNSLFEEEPILQDEEGISDLELIEEKTTKELKLLPELFRVDDIIGDERALLTLEGERWLDDTVMTGYAKHLLQCYGHVDNEGRRAEAVSQTFVVQRLQTEQGVVTWTECLAALPPKDEFNSDNGKLYVINHNMNHWFLVTFCFAEKKMRVFDSGNEAGFISKKVKTEHVNRLKDALEKQYNIQAKVWKGFDVKVPQQLGSNECGVLVLKYLENMMQSKSLNAIDTHETGNFRLEIAKSLLSTTYNGTALLENTKNDIHRALRYLRVRESYRRKLDDYNKLKKEIENRGENEPLFIVEDSIQQIEALSKYILDGKMYWTVNCFLNTKHYIMDSDVASENDPEEIT